MSSYNERLRGENTGWKRKFFIFLQKKYPHDFKIEIIGVQLRYRNKPHFFLYIFNNTLVNEITTLLPIDTPNSIVFHIVPTILRLTIYLSHKIFHLLVLILDNFDSETTIHAILLH